MATYQDPNLPPGFDIANAGPAQPFNPFAPMAATSNPWASSTGGAMPIPGENPYSWGGGTGEPTNPVDWANTNSRATEATPPPTPAGYTGTWFDVPGFDGGKLRDPNKQNDKYTPALRVFSQGISSLSLQPSEQNLPQLVNYAKANGFPNARVTGKDTIDFGDGYGPIDVITNVGGADQAWWFANNRGTGTGAESGGHETARMLTPEQENQQAVGQESIPAIPTPGDSRALPPGTPLPDPSRFDTRTTQEAAARPATGIGSLSWDLEQDRLREAGQPYGPGATNPVDEVTNPAAPNPVAPATGTALPTRNAPRDVNTYGIPEGEATDLWNLLMSRANQSEQVDRNDPIVRNQTDAYSAQQTRAARNYMGQQAESGNPYGNQGAERRRANENAGQNVSAFEATMMANELSARRTEIAQALQGAQGFLTSEQELQLREELTRLEREERQYQFDSSQRQTLDMFDRDLNQQESQFGRSLASTDSRFDRSLASNDRQFDASLGSNNRQFDASLGNNMRQFDASLLSNNRQFDAGLANNQSQFGQSLEAQIAQYYAGLRQRAFEFDQDYGLRVAGA